MDLTKFSVFLGVLLESGLEPSVEPIVIIVCVCVGGGGEGMADILDIFGVNTTCWGLAYVADKNSEYHPPHPREWGIRSSFVWKGVSVVS